MTNKKAKRSSAGPVALIARRKAAVQKLAKSPTTTVTLRLPIELNEWLNEYQHLSYPQRITKGSLVIEGLILAYLSRGRPGETILLESELLSTVHKTKK